MELTGKLHERFNEQIISDKFKKREFVIEFTENPQYPEYIKLELLQDKCSLLDQFNIGDELTVSFNLRGRKYEKEGKVNYFTSLNAWKINKLEPAAPSQQQGAEVPDWMK